MNENDSRRAIKAQYKETHHAAGVYRIVDTQTGMALLGATTNLPSVENRLAFGKSTRSAGALDPRLREAVAASGFDALVFEVLEVLPDEPGRNAQTTRDDLATLEKLWREKLGDASLL